MVKRLAGFNVFSLQFGLAPIMVMFAKRATAVKIAAQAAATCSSARGVYGGAVHVLSQQGALQSHHDPAQLLFQE